ncbi:hypothetical protein ACLB1T_09095 [Escherichia coli]
MQNRWITWWTTAPFITHETAPAAQSLKSPAPGGSCCQRRKGAILSISPGLCITLTIHPLKNSERFPETGTNADAYAVKRRGNRSQKLHLRQLAMTAVRLHSIPDRSGLWRYLSTDIAATDDAG